MSPERTFRKFTKGRLTNEYWPQEIMKIGLAMFCLRLDWNFMD